MGIIDILPQKYTKHTKDYTDVILTYNPFMVFRKLSNSEVVWTDVR